MPPNMDLEEAESSWASSGNVAVEPVINSAVHRKRRRGGPTIDDSASEDPEFVSQFKEICRQRRQQKSRPSSRTCHENDRKFVPQRPKKSKAQQAPSDPQTCPKCSAVFKNERSLKTHLYSIHRVVVRATLGCPIGNCRVMSTKMGTLIQHLNSTHRANLRHETKIFDNMEKYKEWMNRLTLDGSQAFIQSSGARGSAKAPQWVSFYCHTKKNGLGPHVMCPAYFRRLLHSDGRVEVKAQLRHIGHDPKPKLKKLSEYQQLSEGVSQIKSEIERIGRALSLLVPVDYPFEKNDLLTTTLAALNNTRYQLKRASKLISASFPVDQPTEIVNTREIDAECGPEASDDEEGALDDIGEEEDMPELEAVVPVDVDVKEEEEVGEVDVQQMYAPVEGMEPAVADDCYYFVPEQHHQSVETTVDPAAMYAREQESAEDEARIESFKRLPFELTNGRVQCTLCFAVLKSVESYHAHKLLVHPEEFARQKAQPTAGVHVFTPPQESEAVAYDSGLVVDDTGVIFCRFCTAVLQHVCEGGPATGMDPEVAQVQQQRPREFFEGPR